MIKIKKYAALALIAALGGISYSCEKDFDEINTSQTVVDDPDIKFLLAYAEDRVASYQGTEWIWESLEQLFRYTQHMSASPFELSDNVNTRYSAYYNEILPNLFEIRRQIEAKPDKDRYQKAAAVTYVLQVLHGLKVTDMNGSIPYTEAVQGRYDAMYSPKYDAQKELLDTWLVELDRAIGALGNNSLTDQESYGTSDIYYQGDYTKWAKLANTLKLRIAVRYQNQDAAKAQAIFQEVMQDETGPIVADEEQLSYRNTNFSPFNPSDIDYRSRRFGSLSLVGFMKEAEDPRLPVYFDANDLTGSFRDSLDKYNVQLPAFIDPSDPLIMYQGGPADWTTRPEIAAYMSAPLEVGPLRYNLISTINRRFFSPRLDNASGNFVHVLVTHAETCFYIAEFIQKGYGGGIDTKGTAAEWYEQGIASSIRTMNEIAREAGSATAFSEDNAEAAIQAYIEGPEVKLNGENDLERIYIQQYINFYRLANEAFVFVRRTGYPAYGSDYYSREPFNEPIPRRFWLIDPGELNRENWSDALTEQGFTLGSRDLNVLSQERVWYDKPAPDFGEGGQ
ncbi:SusD/RagB family nutrient-binding outer membrane lipoprotein [Pontibacter russatus]|uniref:SusD/RagB family nutrient-binding outer membrane lipoprotein n=1 Tax=Pontibacter russatus TaxID=2694929 RepID=UPI00137A5239|nr:SusD/RagB family nutrient-binding outer membrane lipoprotein [Pontibacter russatus]